MPIEISRGHNPLRDPDDRRLNRIAGPSALVIFGVPLKGSFLGLSLAAVGYVLGTTAIGLVSFAAIAQIGPAFFGGLFWLIG